ncbi:MAG: GNAT family N-acetyltransferase [Bacteroidales bacterium]|nr:GNAT family N-acetyltransferase [Bacteroidales bacterium]
MFTQNENIIIRAAEPIDAELIYEWENDQSIWRVSETYMPYSMYQIEQFLFNNNDLFANRQVRFIIETKKDNEKIGCIDIYDFDPIHQRAGIGILLQENYRKRGHAKESLGLIIDYCFNVLMLKQVYCLIDSLNEDSLNLFKKTGFVQCGYRKEWIRTPDGFIDEIELQYINKNYQ